MLCMRIVNRFTVQLLEEWRALARQFARAKELSNRILARGIDDRFRRWCKHTDMARAEKAESKKKAAKWLKSKGAQT